MATVKPVRTSKETHTSLKTFTAEHGFKSMDETIAYLLKESEYPKNKEAVICSKCGALEETK